MSKIYISLDSILDMRLGVLNTISDEFGFDVISNKEYYIREEDLFSSPNFGKLDNRLFLDVKKKYLDIIPTNSLATTMHLYISELATRHIQNVLNNPIKSNLEIDINFYPYVINDNDSNAIINNVYNLLDGIMPINKVFIPNEKLTVNYIKENYSDMILYEYVEWMNLLEKDLKKINIRDYVRLHVPRLYLDKAKLSKEVEKDLSNMKLDSFEFNQLLLNPIVSIIYLPIALYCVNNQYNKREYYLAN